jgi:hypothetical protein
MRYVLALTLSCLFGLPVAFAAPSIKPHSVSMSQSNQIQTVSSRKQVRAHRSSRRSGGIHPLVGSGDY